MSREVVLDKKTIIVSETDQNGRIIYVNNDFCNISGYTKDELIGKAHNIVRHRDMPKVAFRDLWNTIGRSEVWNGIVKNRTKDGGFYWVNATVFPSKSPDGTLRYLSVRVKPTEKEIDEASALYKKLVQGE